MDATLLEKGCLPKEKFTHSNFTSSDQQLKCCFLNSRLKLKKYNF